ncbi:hypothetical protein ACLOJK_002691 [Asimina triloba]
MTCVISAEVTHMQTKIPMKNNPALYLQPISETPNSSCKKTVINGKREQQQQKQRGLVSVGRIPWPSPSSRSLCSRMGERKERSPLSFMLSAGTN